MNRMEAKMNNVVPFANGKRESEGKKAAAEEKKKVSVDELMEKLRSAFEELEALDKKLEKLIGQEKEALEINDYLFANETMAYLSDRETYMTWADGIRTNKKLLERIKGKKDEIKLDASLEVFNDRVLDVINSWLFERFEGVVAGTLL